MKTYLCQTKLGSLKACSDKDFLFFRGLPYAYTKRFKSPEIITYLGDFDASKTESDCIQAKTYESGEDNSFYGKEFKTSIDHQYQEEVMCLNIISKKSAKQLPVLVFIHGGSFTDGYLNDLPYGGSTEYIKRDVILVTIAYRLNIFGFYRNHNYGLEDQLCALKWLNKYIEDFGGDKNRITLMGQSAGAMCLTDLLYSQKAAGLVNGAIMLSGCGVVPTLAKPYTYEESKAYWDEFLRANHLTNDEDLLTLDQESLFKSWWQYQHEHYSLHIAQPGIDGEIIYDTPKKMLKNGRLLDIPLMIGVTSQDFMGPLCYHMARTYAKYYLKHKNSAVYTYFFDRTPPGNSYKAFHGADLWYLMGQLDKSWRPFKKEDYELKDLMIDYVANFVRSGNPNDNNLPKWDAYDDKQIFKLIKDLQNRKIKPLKAYLLTTYYALFEKGPL